MRASCSWCWPSTCVSLDRVVQPSATCSRRDSTPSMAWWRAHTINAANSVQCSTCSRIGQQEERGGGRRGEESESEVAHSQLSGIILISRASQHVDRCAAHRAGATVPDDVGLLRIPRGARCRQSLVPGQQLRRHRATSIRSTWEPAANSALPVALAHCDVDVPSRLFLARRCIRS